MAVAVDTYDEENGIHPRYKQVEKKNKQKNSQSHIFLATPLPFNGCHFAVFNTFFNFPRFTFMIKQT